MKSRLSARKALALSLLLALLAACSKTETLEAPVSADPVTAPGAAAPADAPAAAATVAEPAVPNNNPVVAPQGSAPVPGTDYVEIANGQPLQPQQGTIEVVEVFNYICPACYNFEPSLRSWKTRLPADVRLTYVPAHFRPDFLVYAKAFFAADALGVEAQTHQIVYEAIHAKHTLPAEGDKPDEAKVAAFYAPYGIPQEKFLSTMNSFAVAGRLNQSKQFMLRSQVGGTPTLVVNGKYAVTYGSAERMLQVTDHLIARERAAQAGTAP